MNNKQQVIGALKVLKESYGYTSSSSIAVSRAISLVEAVMLEEENLTTPAIDWKPLNTDDMKDDEPYLLWREGNVRPFVGCKAVTTAGVKIYTSPGGNFIDGVTHYAEFNMPEGVE